MNWKRCGFSLVEVVIALGVISFALVAILGLFPVAMSAAKDSRNETRAASIAQYVFDQLRSQPPDRASLPLGDDPLVANKSEPINLVTGTPAERYVVYNDNGEAIARVAPEQYTGGTFNTTVTNPAFLAKLSVQANKPVAGVAAVVLEVSYPATIPADKRTMTYFTAYLPAKKP